MKVNPFLTFYLLSKDYPPRNRDKAFVIIKLGSRNAWSTWAAHAHIRYGYPFNEADDDSGWNTGTDDRRAIVS
jgi:hypothetical protein